MQTVRIRYAKQNEALYISHLDVQRAFMRALARSGVKLTLSEGFRPHPRLTFSQPLSVGHGSCCEAVDVRLEEDTPCEELLARFQQVFPQGLMVQKVYVPQTKLSGAAFARWRIEILTSAENAAQTVEQRLNARPLTVEKRSKSGTRETDIAPLIASLNVTSTQEGVLLDAVLSCAPDTYLNPACLLIPLQDLPITHTRYLRTQLLDENMREFY